MSGSSTRKTNTELQAANLTVQNEAGDSLILRYKTETVVAGERTIQSIQVPAGKRYRIRKAVFSSRAIGQFQILFESETVPFAFFDTTPAKNTCVIPFTPDFIAPSGSTVTIKFIDCGNILVPVDVNAALMILVQDNN